MLVTAVSLNPAHGFSKTLQRCLRLIANEGIEGDAHRGTTTQHLYLKRKNPTQPNLAQVHLLASEKLQQLATLGFHIQPGELGENILTEGIDLLALPLGTLLHIGPEAVLQVTGVRTPCSQIDAFCNGLQQHLWGARDASGKRTRDAGIMSIVRTGGLVHTNDPIRIFLPPRPHLPLPPV
jgi:MOSC domain-containing protein YiiM